MKILSGLAVLGKTMHGGEPPVSALSLVSSDITGEFHGLFVGLFRSIFSPHHSVAHSKMKSLINFSPQLRSYIIYSHYVGFGGYKESGYGRDGGKEGLYEYVKPKWQTRAKVKFFGYL